MGCEDLADFRENLQGLCRSCHDEKTDREFPGARERYGKAWQASKERPKRPVEPMDSCDLCGGPMWLDESTCNPTCERGEPGIPDDGWD
jgi:hypothetical protein